MKNEIEELLKKLDICRKGYCSICSYKKNCMDGLIDDCYELFQKIYSEGYLK